MFDDLKKELTDAITQIQDSLARIELQNAAIFSALAVLLKAQGKTIDPPPFAPLAANVPKK